MTSPFSVPSSALDNVSASSKRCLERLLAHVPESSEQLSSLPKSKLAAVLVLLFERDGQLRVLLTTRSKRLRTHPGQTALPGGRVDDTDVNYIQTALREAHEEVGLPLSSEHVHPLCFLRPYVSKYRLFVTPVVAFLDDPTVIGHLTPSPDEVECIFHHPLEAFLDPTLAAGEPLVEIGSEDWPYDEELYNFSDSQIQSLGNLHYRMHRFRSSSSPIKGLTADIMLLVASVAYGRQPTVAMHAPGQPTNFSAFWATIENADPEAPFSALPTTTVVQQEVAA